MIRLNVSAGDLVERNHNGRIFNGVIKTVKNSGSIVVQFDGFSNSFEFQPDTFKSFKTIDGNEIFIFAQDESKKSNKETFYGESNSQAKHLINYIEEVLKEEKDFLTISDIAKRVREKGYKFPHRPDERNTSLETSVNTRLFERILRKDRKFVKIKNSENKNVFKINV